MMENTRISTPQLTCLLMISSVTLILTCNASFLGGNNMEDNLLSCILAFLCNLLLLLPTLLLMRRKTSSNTLLQAEQAGKWLLYPTAVFYVLYLIVMDWMYLSTFQFFLSNTFHPSVPPWIFTLMLIVAAVYASYKGLEALGRSSVLLFLLIFLGILLIGSLLIPDLESENSRPLLLNGPGQMLYGTIFFLLTGSGIVPFGLLFPMVKGKRTLGVILWNAITFAITAFLLIQIVGALGAFANLQLFPFYSAATMASLGPFQRLDSVFLSIWIVGIFIKMALDFYGISLCIRQIIGQKSALFSKAGAGLVVCVGAILISGNRTLLNFFLDPALLLPLTLTAAGLLPLTSLAVNTIRDRKR